jgi:hypothetical protein
MTARRRASETTAAWVGASPDRTGHRPVDGEEAHDLVPVEAGAVVGHHPGVGVDLIEDGIGAGIERVVDDLLEDHRPQAVARAAGLLRQAVGMEEQRPVGADELDLADGGQPCAMTALAQDSGCWLTVPAHAAGHVTRRRWRPWPAVAIGGGTGWAKPISTRATPRRPVMKVSSSAWSKVTVTCRRQGAAARAASVARSTQWALPSAQRATSASRRLAGGCWLLPPRRHC